MRLGLIGLGNMGLHFGTRLLRAGHEVVVFDLDQDAMNRLHRDGAIVAESVRDLAAQVPIVFLSLPTPEIVAKVATGADGVITETDTRIVVDLSTTGPTITRLVADRLDAVGKLLLGAPVSGGTVPPAPIFLLRSSAPAANTARWPYRRRPVRGSPSLRPDP